MGAVVTADGGQQVDELRIATKAGEVVAEGYAPLEFSVTNHDKAYAKGDYKVAWFNHLGVSDYVDLQSFKTVGHVESISITPTTLSAWFGKMTTLQLTVKTTPADAHNKDVVYTTSPANSGLSVQADGKVYVSDKLPIGEYKITATSVDGGKTAVSTLKVSDPIVTWTTDLKGKTVGETTGNPNVIASRATTGMPTSGTAFYEPTQKAYEDAMNLDGTSWTANISVDTQQINLRLANDVVQEIERKFSTAIWQGRTSLADKINISKQLLKSVTNVNNARGSGTIGNKVTLSRFNVNTSAWVLGESNATANIAQLSVSLNTQSQIDTTIDSLGRALFLLHAESSNGTIASSVSLDYTKTIYEVDLSRTVVLPTSTTLMIG